MEQIINQFNNAIGGSLSTVLGAILFLVVGWIFALFVGALVKKLMASMNVNGSFNAGNTNTKGFDLEKLASRLAFWFVFVFAITGALNKLELNAVSAPLSNLLNQVTSFIPSLIGAAIVGLIGWALATLVKNVALKLLTASTLDEKLSTDAGVPPLSNTISNLFYWLIILMFIPMVLEKLNMQGLLAPVQDMIHEMLGFIPDLFAGVLIGVIGYIVAKVLKGVVTNLVSSLNIQSLANKAGLKDTTNIPNLAGSVVFFLIIMNVIILALSALKLEAISRPATNMINKILDVVPNVFAAILILVLFYYVFRFIANMVKEVLANTGADELPEKMGLAQLFGNQKLSSIVGNLILAVAMLFAVIESANKIGFSQIGNLVNSFIKFGSQVVFGGVILMIGFWIANAVSGIVARSQEGSQWLGTLVKVVIMGLVLAMGLKSMGIADSIVNMAFGLTLGSAAVAFAVAFGLGGREAAARVLKNALDKIEKNNR